MNAPRILGLILARGGSKRLPGKNIRPLAGKPLIAWSIDAALQCSALSCVVVSTDDQAIADVALQHGARVPFLRPQALAEDKTTSEDSTLHALAWLREHQGEEFDAVMLVEPTSPLRAGTDLGGVADMLVRRWADTDAVVAVGRVEREHPSIMKRRDGEGRLSPWLPQAQAGGKDGDVWFPYGGAYAVKTEVLQRLRTFYPPRLRGYPVERWQNFEVDDLVDFVCVEAVFRHFGGKLPGF
jgi:CMP-N-acetylneuraminic acid synthetase